MAQAKKKVPKKAQKNVPQKDNSRSKKLKIAAGITGAAGTTALLAFLTKRNMDLKKMVSNLQEEVGYYRKAEMDKGSSRFSFFGKPKPTDSALKQKLEKALNDNNDLTKKLNTSLKDLEIVSGNFKKCDDTLNQCNAAYKNQTKKLEECNAALGKVFVN